jgi:hypothetical protein
MRYETGQFFDASIGLVRWGIRDLLSGRWIIPARDSERAAEAYCLRLNVDG